MKKIFFSIVLTFIAGILIACGGNSDSKKLNSLENIKQNGIVKIGVFGDKPPFGYVDEKGLNQGYDIYLAKRIAKELFGDENKVQFVLVEAANRVEFLKSNKVDIILANFTQTPQRAEQVDFCLPYMKVALGVVVPKHSDITSIEELKDKTLLLNKGTTADAYFTQNYPDIKTLKYDQNTETFAALMDARGDALSHDNTLLFAWVKEHPDFKMAIKELGNKDFIAPAVKKGDKELKEFIDHLILKLNKENFFDKAYDETLKNYFGDDVKAYDIIIKE
ncbi:cysteine ABC transporter substrate-binding protein [Campylobacter hepaticus]|uniref:ABC transporter substrate-binding protein n=1 Tax=Campylobacter hepaticus TaxID=1813019 RepID=A0A424Z059_9BACT|nr:cysteine ABC transporter substrate-binding protein [Campylobacter hepaticus]AXP08514.1 ABC transporter substrate-binding protein [Campylobacter hepaticus]MCZ0772350.1 cysteine ABC transporter substrate-binding protein [Campylobacter hepaticus]MCZ0773818.1 cysteine ABC transporter substrate-binding protein [Campylobacter hepaticus]MCZ0775069.1 cysteine ABC transporter substrate-binding protein [Campylobacter hepaticus]MDX2322938.1 cysteine ABC transporter substrate-binding protein [Campyloba